MNVQHSASTKVAALNGSLHDSERRDHDRRERDRREADHRSLRQLADEVELLDRQLHRERSFVKPFYAD